ncbi:MAG: rod shape-determining protein MreC [Rhodospirillaceae bacterium]|jgi:rod shape-determining protein MreC|nr:rod shape-determining protein MreC [Rhodospirillaceae bacterium]MBT5264840.1 rod shape-determining protein MreC [Rhodospirillaceae bacterium]MBT5414852.1 rod shape-determining protein MreC [Rhodospirillaceae bacterium]
MAQRSGPILRIATPVRALVQRFAFLMLLAGAVGLIVLGKIDTLLVERVRSHVADAFSPILAALSEPVRTTEAVIEELRDLGRLHAENARLREQNERLLRWQTVARQLEAENRDLRGLLNFKSGRVPNQITVRVIADSGGAFVRSVLVDAGARDGVEKGLAAVIGLGLVGRVIEVGNRSARILLVTDLNSRIPVMLAGSGQRSVLAGDNSDRPRLLYMPGDLEISAGERVVTSGHGGVFPPGLPVGTVARVGSGEIRVEPLIGWSELNIVRLIDFRRPVDELAGPPVLNLDPGR